MDLPVEDAAAWSEAMFGSNAIGLISIVNYHMEILPKTSMDAVNRIIDTGDFIVSTKL